MLYRCAVAEHTNNLYVFFCSQFLEVHFSRDKSSLTYMPRLFSKAACKKQHTFDSILASKGQSRSSVYKSHAVSPRLLRSLRRGKRNSEGLNNLRLAFVLLQTCRTDTGVVDPRFRLLQLTNAQGWCNKITHENAARNLFY